ncbi:putative outer membrane protein [Tenacibaculum adriaticum]|uniref:Putative outer membrane protein n=1 Tax=Tenacibaculum adriaticum TaxID=413713 RepID=A0A5S5DPX7_9FLAO|nr:hypothetical protein [Tenacibaculum adriaticum]TYP97993.1 putative outer membrane protein [Tenacibaculum adriaticum]
MKNVIFTLALVCVSFFSVNAQSISENAIGLRFGDNNGFGGEVSYQHKLSSDNRLELDLGLRGDSGYSAFKATALYQWVWQLEDQFNWYVGAGGGLGSWKNKATDNSNTFLFGAGVIGIEYNFDIPLLISFDFRPEIGFSNDIYDGFNSDFGLGIRYQF